MIKQWKNKQFERWTITRKKGQLNYVLKQTLIIGGAVLFGGFIGFIVFDKIRTWEEYWLDFYVQVSALLVFGLIINYFMWIISETIYEKECKKRRLEKSSNS
ncbi:hypothetical protein PVK63_19625 [Aliivibrio sp. S2TY2]|uniref:hypothetical protein n=1 Tax=unclassified Aliivibrio TaxID=2645654 RepID=UPI002378176C|nr:MULTISPECIES: hypothetical protein [unclassified Aliivibrio]MDD9177077.1 hypothetical protein [Aliivibrio sp. S3TY1]MDD9194160.1 hypothetical protein [Aliivibrio sp. S2TY2]